jgi:hypothetical protein
LISRLDDVALRDKFVKDCIGDAAQLVRQVRNEEKEKKNKRTKPNYNADFDAELLDENEEIQVRKTKKIVKRKDSATGEWIEDEIEVDEEVVIDKRTGKELRKREK